VPAAFAVGDILDAIRRHPRVSFFARRELTRLVHAPEVPTLISP